MGKSLAETIKEITRTHLEQNNGLILGQCLSAVGWVNNTVPDCKNIVELPMSDVAAAGIAAGTAITGRRPIFVIRFQDFMFLNSSMIVNFAAKSKFLFGKGIPIFIRALATEGHGTGPVHSGVFHSLFMHVPGFRVCSPITPGEYRDAWRVFMENDEPMYVSEHRKSFNQIEDMKDVILNDADITIFGISAARFNVIEAVEKLKKDGIKCNIIHINWLKPLGISREAFDALNKSNLGIVIDSGLEIAGASQSIAYELMNKTGVKVVALGAMDKTIGAAERYENCTPSVERIMGKIKESVYNKKIFKINNPCLKMKRALIITGQGYQDQEVIYPYYRLLEDEFQVDIAAKNKETLYGILGTKMDSTITFNEMKVEDFDLLVLPGGVKALEKIRQEPIVLEFIKKWDEHGKIIASTCHGAQLMISAKIVRGRKISGYYSIKDDINNSGAEYIDASFVIDKNIVSSPHYKHMGPWMKEVIKLFNEHAGNN